MALLRQRAKSRAVSSTMKRSARVSTPSGAFAVILFQHFTCAGGRHAGGPPIGPFGRGSLARTRALAGSFLNAPRRARVAVGTLPLQRLAGAIPRRSAGSAALAQFVDLDQARQLIGAWVVDYNTARPHSSLGYKTPAAYAGTLTAPKGVTLAEALTAAG